MADRAATDYCKAGRHAGPRHQPVDPLKPFQHACQRLAQDGLSQVRPLGQLVDEPAGSRDVLGVGPSRGAAPCGHNALTSRWVGVSAGLTGAAALRRLYDHRIARLKMADVRTHAGDPSRELVARHEGIGQRTSVVEAGVPGEHTQVCVANTRVRSLYQHVARLHGRHVYLAQRRLVAPVNNDCLALAVEEKDISSPGGGHRLPVQQT